LLVTTVVADAGDFDILAITKIAAAAFAAGVILAAVPAYADALAFLPGGDAGADFVDDAGNFVTGNAGILDSGPETFDGEGVAVTDAAGLDFDADLSGGGAGDFALDDLEA
jgi:hypothetical protein